MILFIYNNQSKRLERYSAEPYEDMPYTDSRAMTVADFFGRSESTVGWSSSSFLESWNTFSRGRVRAEHVFCRIHEGGHIAQSMHYAGIAADIPLSAKTAVEHFPYSEAHEAHIHVAQARAGYPGLRLGDSGLFVLILQDALNALGFFDSPTDGFFGYKTARMLKAFQRSTGLPMTGDADSQSFRTLLLRAVGCGGEQSTHVRRPKFFCFFSNPSFL